MAKMLKQGATTIRITNDEASAMAALVEFPRLIEAGQEISVAATKTYTCQLLALCWVAHPLNGPIALDQLRKTTDWVRVGLAREENIETSVEWYFLTTRAVTAWFELRRCSLIQIEVGGDLLCCRRAVFGSKPDARADRFDRTSLSCTRLAHLRDSIQIRRAMCTRSHGRCSR